MQRFSHPLLCNSTARKIISRLREQGFEAYLVGGCVRDQLLGGSPKDWDIATSATPEAIERLFPRTIGVGRQFGVMLVVMENDEFEVATFRGDGKYSDGRRPDSIRFTDAEEDAKRRDFTINALFYDPLEKQVIDFVGGLPDLEKKVLRTVGDPDERFAEDHLRLLRAVRFAARTNFELEGKTLEAVCRLAQLVSDVSSERIHVELTRMLSEGSARQAFDLLEKTGLLEITLPKVAAMRGVEQPPQFHPEGDVWEHTRIMLQLLDDSPALAGETADRDPYVDDQGILRIPRLADRKNLAWATLLHDIGKPPCMSFRDRIRFNGHDTVGAKMAVNLLRRLHASNHQCNTVGDLVAGHMRFCMLKKMREAKQRRFFQQKDFALHLELHRLDCLSSHGKLDAYEYGLAGWQEELARPIPPEPLLTGRDLIASGYPPGPNMGLILEAVQDASLEGSVSTRDEAMNWVRAHFPK